ncbi:MAG: DUF2199 domain-containing protein [Acidobacteriaceae bacterium]|nr:DUF2199 domain-containing protein [Acidobacteriaceae bacterium]
MTSTCAVCGSEHDEEALELGYRRPDAVIDLDAEARAAGVFENDDLCVIDASRFFIRATLPLPVNGRGENYQIGVWVEVASPDFDRIGKLWTDPGQAAEPPMSATLANEPAPSGQPRQARAAAADGPEDTSAGIRPWMRRTRWAPNSGTASARIARANIP